MSTACLLTVRRAVTVTALAVTAALAAGCAGLPGPASPGGTALDGGGAATSLTGTGLAALERGALPPGAVFRAEQSLVFGTGDQWVGRLVADVGRDVDAAYRYFAEQYPTQGWTLISAVRGKNSLLVFTRQDRTATVELAESHALSGGAVVVTVSPRSANANPAIRPGGPATTAPGAAAPVR